MRETSIFEARITHKEHPWWNFLLWVFITVMAVSLAGILNQLVEKVGYRFFPCGTFMGYFFNSLHTCAPCVDTVTTSCNVWAGIPIITPVILAILGVVVIVLVVRSENAQRVARSKNRNLVPTPKITSSQIRNKRSKKQK